jgi:hypothetical protein
MITHSPLPARFSVDASSDDQRCSLATSGSAFHPASATSQQGFPAELSLKAQNKDMLQSSTAEHPSAAMQQPQQRFPPPQLPNFSPSSQEQIMQRAITHQGLERVFLMYALLSRIVRRIAGSLAITQKAR